MGPSRATGPGPDRAGAPGSAGRKGWLQRGGVVNGDYRRQGPSSRPLETARCAAGCADPQEFAACYGREVIRGWLWVATPVPGGAGGGGALLVGAAVPVQDQHGRVVEQLPAGGLLHRVGQCLHCLPGGGRSLIWLSRSGMRAWEALRSSIPSVSSTSRSPGSSCALQ